MASQRHPSDCPIPLPVEIRLKIYALLFRFRCEGTLYEPEDQIIILDRPFQIPRCKTTEETDFSFALPLLRTCKPISAEASFVLYSENHFQIRAFNATPNFAKRIGPRNAAFIRYLYLDLDLDFGVNPELLWSYASDAALQFSNLRRLSVHAVGWDFWLPFQARQTKMVLRAAQVLLENHPSLCLTASGRLGGRDKEQLWRQIWSDGHVHLTFLASEHDKKFKDGPILQVEELIESVDIYLSTSSV